MPAMSNHLIQVGMNPDWLIITSKMSIGRFARSLHRSFKSYSQTRGISSAPVESCYVLGKHGPVAIRGHTWTPCVDYFKTKPLVSFIAPERLNIMMDLTRPYLSDDKSRSLINNGLNLPHYAKEHKESYSGCFKLENVGIIEELNILAFKQLKQDGDKIWIQNPSASFNVYSDFLKIFIMPIIQNHSSTCYPPEDTESFLACLSATVVDEEFAMNHPATFSDQMFAAVVIEIYRLMREEWVLLQKPFVRSIFEKIGEKIYPDCLLTCQNHAYLNCFLNEKYMNPSFIPPVSSKRRSRGAHGASAAAGAARFSGQNASSGAPGISVQNASAAVASGVSGQTAAGYPPSLGFSGQNASFGAAGYPAYSGAGQTAAGYPPSLGFSGQNASFGAAGFPAYSGAAGARSSNVGSGSLPYASVPVMPIIQGDPLYVWIGNGMVMIDVHRHCCIHPVKKQSWDMMVQYLPPQAAVSLYHHLPTRTECIEFLRCTFGAQLPITIKVIKDVDEAWKALDIGQFRSLHEHDLYRADLLR